VSLTPSDVAVVVPVGGAAPAWTRAARSLAGLDPAPGALVTVIDGPDDALAATGAEIGARVVVLEERGGPARARNRGAEAAGQDLLLFVDADIEVPPELVARVVEIFNAHPELGAVMGSYDDAPGDPGFLSQYRNLLHHFVHQNGREVASTFWAGCGAVRRRAFLEVGGFDESWVDRIEDIELGARLLRAGHSIRLARDLQVKHLKRWRLFDMLATDLWRRAVPWTELMLREGQMADDLNVRLRDRVSVATAFVVLLALPLAGAWPHALGVAGGATALMVALNAPLLGFFRRQRGFLFALAVVPLYWVFLLVCGLGFALGVLRHLLGRMRREGPELE
jgi:GT2 family glycosyltransferase